jgi:hypothetical protein
VVYKLYCQADEEFAIIEGSIAKMPTKQDHILGKIIALTRNIHLKEPLDGSGFSSSFFAGKRDFQSPFLSSGFGLEWWLTKDAFSFCEDIANMTLTHDPKFEGGEQSSFSERIKSVLQEIVIDKNIFDVDKIFLRKAYTLFEARAKKDKHEFALQVWYKIKEAFVNLMATWIVLYPLNRIKSPSVSLGFGGLSLLAANDLIFWENIITDYSNAKNWNPLTGRFKDNKEPLFNFQSPQTWLVCQVNGTDKNVRRLAGFRMSTFIAVLFAYLYNNVPNLLSKSTAQEFTYSIQSQPLKDIGNVAMTALFNYLN